MLILKLEKEDYYHRYLGSKLIKKNVQYNAVKDSRAGDDFHYRWAARRCLKLVYPKSSLDHIIVEGSDKSCLGGEYSLDLTEYWNPTTNTQSTICYYQLKHTIRQKTKSFTLSLLKDTFKGFGKRYQGHIKEKSTKTNIKYYIITNRPFSKQFRIGLDEIRKGENVDIQFQKILEQYTGLSKGTLKDFISSLEIIDYESDYLGQRFELRDELQQLSCGIIDNSEIENITALVRDKILPHENGKILPQDIYKRFGITNESDLYPAPSEIEEIKDPIIREQVEPFYQQIKQAENPIIIHAEGGVGKSIFAKQLIDFLSPGDYGIVYDCFGGGKYRTSSKRRHRHRDALIQVVNELATMGLCSPLLSYKASDDDIIKSFLSRLNEASISLRKINTNSLLVLLFDAADNAEMAAKEFSESCFAHEILREKIPDGCRIVALCRTERISLLQPKDCIIKLKLNPFSLDESTEMLKRRFPKATYYDGQEFHRLTTGNPRVQTYALHERFKTIPEVLENIGPSNKTVDKQIAAQLDKAISVIKENLSKDYIKEIDALCTGLASLPPFIPLEVLATVSNTKIEAIKSFSYELASSLWITENYVHFRDEPSETWFRKKYIGSKSQYKNYVELLKPLSGKYPYISQILPSLLIQAGNYKELIKIALEDDLLPDDNPIEQRNIRVYRLQFAFKAAISKKQYFDAIKLAMRAGEEMASSSRQLDLLKNNIDLILPLHGENKLSELAFTHSIKSQWDGSDNVFSASLLSCSENYRGDSQAYLRSSNRWLTIYFEELKKAEPRQYHSEIIKEDILELFTTYFNLYGAKDSVEYLNRWQPATLRYQVGELFCDRLIDSGNFAAIENILNISFKYPYIILAMVYRLLLVGWLPDQTVLKGTFNLLYRNKTRLPKPDLFNRSSFSLAIITFLEVCSQNGFPNKKILTILNYYFPPRLTDSILDSYFKEPRQCYLRATALRLYIQDKKDIDVVKILPRDISKNSKSYNSEQKIKEFEKIINSLLPWYQLRIRTLFNTITNLSQEITKTEKKSSYALHSHYKDFDSVPNEISLVKNDILTFAKSQSPSKVIEYYNKEIKNNQNTTLDDRINLLRTANRLEHLSPIKENYENIIYNYIKAISNESPERKASWYIKLSRAVFSNNLTEAKSYFDLAIDSVSKFGDEVVQRWEAVSCIANSCVNGIKLDYELLYRFIRSAELVGEFTEEKYWNRNESINILSRLSPSFALATLSRWRDRDIGWFYSLIQSLAFELNSQKIFSPTLCWSLSAFFKENNVAEFGDACLRNEKDFENQKYILNKAVQDLSFHESNKGKWELLSESAKEINVNNNIIDETLKSLYKENDKGKSKPPYYNPVSINTQKGKDLDLDKILEDIDILSHVGISSAIKRINKLHSYKISKYELWSILVGIVKTGGELSFIMQTIDAEEVDLFDIRIMLQTIPKSWRLKASITSRIDDIFNKIGKRFAYNLTDSYSFKYFISEIPFADISDSLINGMLGELSTINELGDSNLFFGFVKIAIKKITKKESIKLLDYSLSRFEIHIDDDFGDGLWSEWLIPPQDNLEAFAGFIWAALGSPNSEIRWRAMHCLKRISEVNSTEIIEKMFLWLHKDSIESFGCINFPFYFLHAKLYLLIALTRISLDNPKILSRHSNIFIYYALKHNKHILIQLYAAKIALNIEDSFKGTYTPKILTQLMNVGKSSLPSIQFDAHKDKINSFWHENNLVDFETKFLHGWDIDRYWYEPLGRVFGISQQQIIDLANNVIKNDFKLNIIGSYTEDPRHLIWRSSMYDRQTWHDHGSYPKTDNYSFYLSYHSMLIVASKLLDKMPVVEDFSWHSDSEWNYWLKGHLLTRSDDKWVSERRDPAPLKIPTWKNKQEEVKWKSEISEDDFLSNLLFKFSNETWINMFGHISEHEFSRYETISLSSALVPKAYSKSLLYSLSTHKDSHSYRLPMYLDEENQLDLEPFTLKGWIYKDSVDNRLDRFDPFAANIDYPPYKIGATIADNLNLTADDDFRKWTKSKTKKYVAKSELWKSNTETDTKDPSRAGSKISVSLDFIKELCLFEKSHLVIKIEIDRHYTRNSPYRDKNEKEYKPPPSRIYIITEGGRLKGERSDYQIR